MGFRTAAALATEEPAEGPLVLTVAELCERLRALLRAQPRPVDVRGEVRDVVRPPSGHAYFTLRDGGGQIPCVLFRADADALPFRLEDGVSVVVRADLDFYPARGQPQLLVRWMRPRGVGDLWLAFEATRGHLARDGLLEAARKRPIPRFPRRIGVVTSEVGAAIHDVLHVLRRRFPPAGVLLAPALVQGADAPASLAAGIRRLAEHGDVDVILLVRGGGGTEDLWAFNDEGLARAIAASPVPVVAAVGHETDVTIAGLVADLRAPTPSAAAEVASPDVEDLRRQVASLGDALAQAAQTGMRDARQRLDALGAVLTTATIEVRLSEAHRRLALAAEALRDVPRRLRLHRQALDAVRAHLEALGPFATLARGYAVAIHGDRVLRSVAPVAPGDPLLLMLPDGDVECRAIRTRKK